MESSVMMSENFNPAIAEAALRTKKRSFSVYLSRFAYSGNSGYPSLLPQIADWQTNLYHDCQMDSSVSNLFMPPAYSDTPITMTRNKAVQDARAAGADFLLMMDSDNAPDCEPDGKPFWDTSWEFVKNHYEKGPCVVFAPYGGPPPTEVPYVFKWAANENDVQDSFQLKMLEREEAALYMGIHEMAAGPTGLILYDMRCFDLYDPPYFNYEYTDKYCTEKASTEDVFNLRNISLAGLNHLGYNPVFCNFDAWAGHAKNKMVRKPRPLQASGICEQMKRALRHEKPAGTRIVNFKNGQPVM